MTNKRSASQAVCPPTEARPCPFPARADSRSMVTGSSRVSPGTTWRRKRARSIPPKRGNVPEYAGRAVPRCPRAVPSTRPSALRGGSAAPGNGRRRSPRPPSIPSDLCGDARIDCGQLGHEEKGGRWGRTSAERQRVHGSGGRLQRAALWRSFLAGAFFAGVFLRWCFLGLRRLSWLRPSWAPSCRRHRLLRGLLRRCRGLLRRGFLGRRRCLRGRCLLGRRCDLLGGRLRLGCRLDRRDGQLALGNGQLGHPGSGGSSPASTNERTSPFFRTCRALVGGGVPIAVSGI